MQLTYGQTCQCDGMTDRQDICLTYRQTGCVNLIQFPPETAENWWRYGGELVTK